MPLRLMSDEETVEVNVNTVFRANTSDALLQALESGMGIGGMQRPLVAGLCRRARWYRCCPTGGYPIASSMPFILMPALFRSASEGRQRD